MPGALPVVAGWTAAGAPPDASAWMHREDYRRAGLRMLTVSDIRGRATGRQVLTYTAALIPVSLAPTTHGITGLVYFWGALALGAGYLLAGATMAVAPSRRTARILFIASLVYLPALYVLMAADAGGASPAAISATSVPTAAHSTA